ncbi:flagellar basal body-associated FliL family protein [Nitriliruptoraceae bacterium ZYF776]|nr:flagellar basal body-associated FliL family protein [Profundirhabdus halotolerans]
MSATIAPTAPEATEGETKKGGKRKLVLILLVVLLVAGAAYWFLLKPAPEADADAEVPDGPIVALDPLTTTTGEASLRHARVAMSLVLVEGADPVAVTDRAPLLQDALLREVARMDGDELRSAEGSDALRAHLTEAAQGIWDEGEVKRVVLTELLIQ